MLLEAELAGADAAPRILDELVARPGAAALGGRIARLRGMYAFQRGDYATVQAQLAVARAALATPPDALALAATCCFELAALTCETKEEPRERYRQLAAELQPPAKSSPHGTSLNLALAYATFHGQPLAYRNRSAALRVPDTLLRRVDGDVADLEALLASWPTLAERGAGAIRSELQALSDPSRARPTREAWIDLTGACFELHVARPNAAIGLASRVVRDVPDELHLVLAALGLQLTATLAYCRFESAQAIAELHAERYAAWAEIADIGKEVVAAFGNANQRDYVRFKTRVLGELEHAADPERRTYLLDLLVEMAGILCGEISPERTDARELAERMRAPVG
jgi:hypothetical protein